MHRRLGEPAGRAWEDARSGLPSFTRASLAPPAGLPTDQHPFEEHRRARRRRLSGESRLRHRRASRAVRVVDRRRTPPVPDASASEPSLIIHSREPLNAEPPLDRLRAAFITPEPDFYVRSHGEIPNLDAALLPRLRAQRGPAPAVRARLQSRQLPAQPRAARRRGAMVALDPTREAREDRRPDRAPRPLPRVPAGRGGGAARPVRRDPAPDRPLARTARCGGLTRADRGAAGAEGRTVRRDRPKGPKQPGSGPGPRFSGSFRPRPAGGHARELTGNGSRSRVSGADRAHLGNVGVHLLEGKRGSRATTSWKVS